ncbi:MAG: hypothetical protein GF308_21360 [Candidatus Heimdallarchaeota archaeon]|nr:hypothetical protein [Candidatus Heimdallarchaeota archaeon]
MDKGRIMMEKEKGLISGNYKIIAIVITVALLLLPIQQVHQLVMITELLPQREPPAASSLFSMNEDDARKINNWNTSNCYKIGQWNDNYGIPKECWIEDNFAYIISTSGLLIFNIVNPVEPELIKQLNFQNTFTPYLQDIYDLYLHENFAYLCTTDYGLVIINIINPHDPEVLEYGFHLKIGLGSSPPRKIFVKGNYAYIGTSTDLFVVDVSDPTDPIQVGNFSNVRTTSLCLSDDYLYVGNRLNYSLDVFDVSDPTNITRISRVFFEFADTINDIILDQDLVYIAHDWQGLKILNSSNSENLTLINSYDVNNYVMDLFLAGNNLFLANYDGGLIILDISNPEELIKEGEYHDGGSVIGISGNLQVNLLVLADELDGLEWLDIQTLNNPVELAQTPIGGYSSNVIIQDNFAFVADNEEGLEIIALHNPSAPQEISQYKPLKNVGVVDLAIKDSYAFLLCSIPALYIIDISNPFLPIEVGMIAEGGDFLEVSGNLAFIVSGEKLKIIDITYPANPIHISTYDYSNIENLFLHNQFAYIAQRYYGVKIVDFSDPTNLEIVGVIHTTEIPTQDYPTSVFVQQHLAFVTDIQTGLLIFDISDKMAPQLVGSDDSYSEEFIPEILVIQQLAFIALEERGVEMIDVSNLNNLQHLTSYLDWGRIEGMDFWGDQLYLAWGFYGLVILQSDSFPIFYGTTASSSSLVFLWLSFMNLIVLSLLVLVTYQKSTNDPKNRKKKEF